MKATITHTRLKELLTYNPSTGKFFWNTGRNNQITSGSEAGTVHRTGYVNIIIDRKIYQAHRLAWFFINGYFPEYDIDHLNGDRQDNRFLNLRHVSTKCNMQNQIKSSRNTSGFPGVTWGKKEGKWRGQVGVNGKNISLGFYTSALEAALARLTFEIQCPEWTCNHRSELVKSIKSMWPEFNLRGLQ